MKNQALYEIVCSTSLIGWKAISERVVTNVSNQVRLGLQ